MKLFIGWSGDRSKAVAKALREWLPTIINDIQPFMSEEDINKGDTWALTLGDALNDAKFGLMCLTPENVDEPWILFEAGALAKGLGKEKVCPYLLDLKTTNLRQPLGLLMASTTEKGDTEKLIRSINGAVKESQGVYLEEPALRASFERGWPDLEQQIKAIPPAKSLKRQERAEKELLEEILGIVRAMSQRGGSGDFSPSSEALVNALLASKAFTTPLSPTSGALYLLEKMEGDQLTEHEKDRIRRRLRLLEVSSPAAERSEETPQTQSKPRKDDDKDPSK